MIININIHPHELRELRKIMSAWKDEVEALIATIAAGAEEDQATKDAVAALQDKLSLDESANAETTVRVAALETGAAEMQEVIKDIVTRLQAGDPAGALTVAQTANDAAAS